MNAAAIRAARPAAAVAVATALCATWFALRIGGSTTTAWVDDTATELAALLGTVLCLRARRRDVPEHRRFWGLLGAALAAWTAAEVIWAIYELILRSEVPVPSWADAGYLGAIPLVLLALLSHPTMRGGWTRKTRTTLDGLVAAIALFLVSWTVVLGALWRHTDLSGLGRVVTLAYPFGDVVIVFFVVLVARRMTHGRRLGLSWLLAGLLAMALTDSLYAYLTQTGSYSDGGPIDAGWIAAYLCIAVAAQCSKAEPESSAGASTDEVIEQPRLGPVVIPFIPMLVALTVVAVETRLGETPDRVTVIAAFTLVVLVLIRQALLVRDLIAPRRGLGGSRFERLHTALAELQR